MLGERGPSGDQRRNDQRRPHQGNTIPNSKRDGSCLRLRYSCCNRAHLGQNAESTPCRSALLYTAASTTCFVATSSLAKATRRAVARRWTKSTTTTASYRRSPASWAPGDFADTEEAFAPPSRSLCNKGLRAMASLQRPRRLVHRARPVGLNLRTNLATVCVEHAHGDGVSSEGRLGGRFVWAVRFNCRLGCRSC
jgi:hypothetical protein